MSHAHSPNVAVIGVGQTGFRARWDDMTYVELAQKAAMQALRNARMSIDEIDAVVFSMAPTHFMGVADCEKWAVDFIGASGKPFMRVHTGGATGGSAFHAAWSHVASGQYRSVLVVGADRITETPDAQFILNLIWDPLYEQDFALNTVTMTSLSTQRYMARYGVTEEQYARVVVRARRNAMRNPNAHLKGLITVDDVMRSQRVAWPYKLYDICPRSAGAAAVVITDEALARERCTKPAFVTGIGGISNTVFMGDRCVPSADCDFAEHAELAIAARECYAQAGITKPAQEIQVLELYDPFSSFQFPELESLGFCERGHAARLSDEGAFEAGGITCVGPSGGTLCTNPIGVTGLVRVADAALQIMGQAGDMQVSGVNNALATAAGGSTQFFAVTLLSNEPRQSGQA